MTAEPTRERVEAYEAALGCERVTRPLRDVKGRWLDGVERCNTHDITFVPATDLGCPVAVAAARVEAEHSQLWKDRCHKADAAMDRAEAQRDALRAVVEQVRAIHGNSIDPTECMECDHDAQSAYQHPHPCRTLALLPEATS